MTTTAEETTVELLRDINRKLDDLIAVLAPFRPMLERAAPGGKPTMTGMMQLRKGLRDGRA